MIKPTLQIEAGQIVASSVDVAHNFERRHDIVLRAISELLPHVSEGFSLRNITESTYTDSRGKQQRCYHLTRDGFAMIALGFTGEKAIKFREAYVTRFSEMEAYLRRKQYRERLLGTPTISDAVQVALGNARGEFSLTFAIGLMTVRGLNLPPISRDALVKLIKTGVIEGFKHDRQWHVYQDSFAAWLDRRKSDG